MAAGVTKRLWELSELALLWQIFSRDRGGWDSQIRFSVTHGWSASWRADHGRHNVELGRRARRLAQAILGSPGAQGAAADVSALCGGADRAWRSQEHSANGRAACAG